MSLDVYLKKKDLSKETCICPHCNNEHTHEFYETVFTTNITHNLWKMAEACGIYDVIWHPEQLNITEARDLIDPLKVGLTKLISDPEFYKKFNASNHWGTYETFVKFVKNYLLACIENPDATIHLWR